jgi:GTP cyclohydrolase II
LDKILSTNALPNAVTSLGDRNAQRPLSTRPGDSALETAIRALRRGDVVRLTGPEGAVLMLAADGITDAALGRLRGQSEKPLDFVLTAARARALGFDVAQRTAVVSFSVGGSIGAVTISGVANPLAPVSATSDFPPPTCSVSDTSLAAIQLAKRAELLPAVVLGTLTETSLILASTPSLAVDELLAQLGGAAPNLTRVSEANVPLAEAEATRIVAYRLDDGGPDHLALIIGNPAPDQPVLTRLHSACLTGDLLGSLRCDCGDQLRGAVEAIAKEGGGVLLYLAQEGRGIGIANKLRAYALQDVGFDTLDANEQLGFAPDERSYTTAAAMLRDLGFPAVRLMTNNPDKVAGLAAAGIDVVERVSHAFPANEHNRRYLNTKATRAGHLF